MPELGEGWAASVKGGIAGALQQVNDERKQYLKYLDDRSKVTAPADAYQEQVELLDRGDFGTEDIYLDTFTIQGQYASAFEQDTSGQLHVAIGTPAASVLPISASADITAGISTKSTSNANLTMAATFKSRPRSDFLQAVQGALPPRPVAAASGTPAGNQPGNAPVKNQ